MAQKRLPQRAQAWVEARQRHGLSHAHVQMAREIGLNPKKLGKLDNHQQEPWKLPLPAFIEKLYLKHFGKRRPDVAESAALPGTRGHDEAGRPDAFVLFERGAIEQRIVHDEGRVELRRAERQQEALTQKYAAYVQTHENPVSFEKFISVLKMLNRE